MFLRAAGATLSGLRVPTKMEFVIPGLPKLNPGLKLANTFGVTLRVQLANTFGVTLRVQLAKTFGVTLRVQLANTFGVTLRVRRFQRYAVNQCSQS